MVEGGIAELAAARRTRLWDTIGRLDDDELRARVERSTQDAERTIEEWHAFVEGRGRAIRATRATRTSRGVGRTAGSMTTLAS
jgi:hypothetical protein